MFKPNFHYTTKIVRNVALISEARAIILNAPLVPKWEVTLRRDALLRSAHASTSIEGNPLSFEEVSKLAEGREVMVGRKDRQEVLNYLEALEKIPAFAGKVPFSVNDLLRIHSIITKDALENPKDEGALRDRQVVVGNRITGEVVFMPPPTEEVPNLVEAFLGWLNSPEANATDPVIAAGLTHYELVRIHPFVDGNGRLARVMATLVLYRRSFDSKRFFALDDYYDHDRRAYYAALKSVDQGALDTTGWLEYFTDGVAISLAAVRDKVLALSKEVRFLKDRGQIALTEKQMKIVERLLAKDRLGIGEISEMFGISRQGALKEMNKLVGLKIARLKGKGRGAHYVLV